MTEALVTAQTHFVAVSPRELPAAQLQVADWCQQKIRALGRELREQRENLRQAKRLKWRHTGWLTAVNKTKRLMVYYAKIQSALKQGYLIVPNFNVDVIAVRVKAETPNEAVDINAAQCEVLAPQQGRYVDNELIGKTVDRKYTDSQGKERTARDFHATHFEEHIDFPVALVKPSILEATSRAMAIRVFDRIGVVTGIRQDPIVVGQIFSPTERYRRYNTGKRVTFFIAWWLDPTML